MFSLSNFVKMKEVKETFKIMREQRQVPADVKENLKEFNQIKRLILKELRTEDLTIAQLCERIGMPSDKMVYYLLSLVKFGLVSTGEIDDMDEYFKYKVK